MGLYTVLDMGSCRLGLFNIKVMRFKTPTKSRRDGIVIENLKTGENQTQLAVVVYNQQPTTKILVMR
jgi:hypothetical protein